MTPQLNDADRSILEKAAIPEEEAQRQLEVLRGERTYRRLDRPCRIGDGIVAVEDEQIEELVRLHESAAQAGRMMKFVPASGAATRMFRDLSVWMGTEDDIVPAAIEAFFIRLEEFPFHAAASAGLPRIDDSAEGTGRAQRLRSFLRYVLTPEGLGYLTLPKALIPFHRYPDEVRTAFAEHLIEALSLARTGEGACRVHFTIGEAHQPRFEAERDALAEELDARFSCRLHVDFSRQEPHTDTLALDGDGGPFRTRDGTLLLRPGGHGALLENVGRAAGDILLIKNIDNIQCQPAREAHRWLKVIGGLAVRIHAQLGAVLRRLGDASEQELDEALTFVTDELGQPISSQEQLGSTDHKRDLLRRRLHRPLRVCGVVRNEGHPGGGPFWVRGDDGTVTRQIVESAEIDREDRDQETILNASTHFNPVIMACAVRDFEDRAFQLEDFRDPSTCFLAEKSHERRPLLALEHPGLWNGSMAGWNTVFVELPSSTFSPVKTIDDLLHPSHQPDLRLSA
ncbi:MAG: DUF4301 family protein [Thermoanaerobaculia bacterium]|nr:DUF4301 family protein [Thermoanaerobaculia bacterium]